MKSSYSNVVSYPFTMLSDIYDGSSPVQNVPVAESRRHMSVYVASATSPKYDAGSPGKGRGSEAQANTTDDRYAVRD